MNNAVCLCRLTAIEHDWLNTDLKNGRKLRQEIVLGVGDGGLGVSVLSACCTKNHEAEKPPKQICSIANRSLSAGSTGDSSLGGVVVSWIGTCRRKRNRCYRARASRSTDSNRRYHCWRFVVFSSPFEKA